MNVSCIANNSKLNSINSKKVSRLNKSNFGVVEKSDAVPQDLSQPPEPLGTASTPWDPGNLPGTTDI